VSRRCGPCGGCARRRAGDAPGRAAYGEAKAKKCAAWRARGTSRVIPFLKPHAAHTARMERVEARVRPRPHSSAKSEAVLAIYRLQMRKYRRVQQKAHVKKERRSAPCAKALRWGRWLLDI
jgi:hypothetical protein